jgi:hypothetical protein
MKNWDKIIEDYIEKEYRPKLSKEANIGFFKGSGWRFILESQLKDFVNYIKRIKD